MTKSINEFNALIPLDIQFFAGETPPADQDETIPSGQPSDEPNLDASDNDKSEKVKSFTQAELDDILAKRIERERKKYADYDELKTKASEYEAKLQAQREAEMSEIEKAQEQAKQFEDQLSTLTAQLEAERTKAQQDKIRFEFTKVASSANIIDVDAAIALSDLSAVSIDDDGKVVGVDDVVKALVENKPYLVAKKQTQPIGTATNGGGQQYHDKPAEQVLEELRLKARKSGRIEDRVAFDKARKQYGK